MRFLYFLLLLVFVAAIVVFAVQNKDDVTLKFLDRGGSFPLPIVVGAVYVLGMLTGWTVIGLIKRSVQRVTERREAK